jgi:hypothetical protein
MTLNAYIMCQYLVCKSFVNCPKMWLQRDTSPVFLVTCHIFFLYFVYLFPFANTLRLCNNSNTFCNDALCRCLGTVIYWPPVGKFSGLAPVWSQGCGIWEIRCLHIFKKLYLVYLKKKGMYGCETWSVTLREELKTEGVWEHHSEKNIWT